MSSPAANSIRVHLLDTTGRKMAQIRMRASPATNFGELRNLASERYLEMTGNPITLQRVQDCDGNDFYLKDPVDHLEKGEIVLMIKSPPAGVAARRSVLDGMTSPPELDGVVPNSQVDEARAREDVSQSCAAAA